jgi:hypothetical protein
MTRVCLLIALGILAGCNQFSLDTYWRSGNYVLIAIDTRGQMNLATDDGHGMASTLIGPTVFSIGADDGHRAVTNYFVVDRAGGQRTVHGPLSADEFNKLSASEGLPAFTKTFNDLK